MHDLSTDTPALLFLPGAGGDARFWSHVGQRLPDAWHKIYLAWPGLGHNPPAPDVNGFWDLVHLTERHLPARGAHLIAHSLGGAVALWVALRNPERVRHLVLIASGAGLDVRRFEPTDWRPKYRQEHPHAAEWVYNIDAALEGQFGAGAPQTLLLWGDADPISPVTVGQHLAQQLPDGTLHVIRGGTHALAVERAEEVAALVERHLTA